MVVGADGRRRAGRATCRASGAGPPSARRRPGTSPRCAAHHDDLGAESRRGAGASRSSRSPSRSSALQPESVIAYSSSGPSHQRVQGDGDRAERHRRPEAHHPLRVVAHADGDAVALADAVLATPARRRARRRCRGARRASCARRRRRGSRDRRTPRSWRGSRASTPGRWRRRAAARRRARSVCSSNGCPAAVSAAMASARVTATVSRPPVPAGPGRAAS